MPATTTTAVILLILGFALGFVACFLIRMLHDRRTAFDRERDAEEAARADRDREKKARAEYQHNRKLEADAVNEAARQHLTIGALLAPNVMTQIRVLVQQARSRGQHPIAVHVSREVHTELVDELTQIAMFTTVSRFATEKLTTTWGDLPVVVQAPITIECTPDMESADVVLERAHRAMLKTPRPVTDQAEVDAALSPLNSHRYPHVRPVQTITPALDDAPGPDDIRDGRPF